MVHDRGPRTASVPAARGRLGRRDAARPAQRHRSLGRRRVGGPRGDPARPPGRRLPRGPADDLPGDRAAADGRRHRPGHRCRRRPARGPTRGVRRRGRHGRDQRSARTACRLGARHLPRAAGRRPPGHRAGDDPRFRAPAPVLAGGRHPGGLRDAARRSEGVQPDRLAAASGARRGALGPAAGRCRHRARAGHPSDRDHRARRRGRRGAPVRRGRRGCAVRRRGPGRPVR